jgi:hypothetical protein
MGQLMSNSAIHAVAGRENIFVPATQRCVSPHSARFHRTLPPSPLRLHKSHILLKSVGSRLSPHSHFKTSLLLPLLRSLTDLSKRIGWGLVPRLSTTEF